MPTHYLLRSDGTLRHGHGNANAPDPTKEQWHSADTYHRADPDGHDREESWTNPIWSTQNWDKTRAEKDDLVLRAYLAYERNKRSADYYGYKVSAKPHPRAVLGLSPRDLPAMPVGSANATTAPATLEAVTPPEADVDDKPTDEEADDEKARRDEEARTAPKIEVYEEPLPDAAPVEYTSSSLQDIEERLATVEEVALEHLPTMDKKIQDLTTRVASEERVGLALKIDVQEDLRVLREDLKKIDVSEQLAPLAARVKAVEDAQARKVEYTVRTPEKVIVSSGVRHEAFDKLLILTLALDPLDRNIWMTGPAGSGKTKMAPQLAEALELEFEASGPLDTPYKISGYKDANGNYHDTAFRRAFQHGKVMLCDEVDFSHPGALAEINAATSNGWAAFPDGMVQRHKNFICLAAANTYGMGGDAVYIGTTRQNAASLDRFVMIDVNYDETLEASISLDAEWTRVVQTCRAAANEAGAQIVISPRSSIKGGQLLSQGVRRDMVLEALFGKHKKLSGYQTIFAAAIRWARGDSTDDDAGRRLNNQIGKIGSRLGSVNFSRVR